MEKRDYPFPAIVGQEKMKQALILNTINPAISGVLIRGEKGTAKSTAVRSLAEILPEIEVIEGCRFQLDPVTEYEQYRALSAAAGDTPLPAGQPAVSRRRIEVVELPVGATEDRLVGTLDLEHALKKGEKRVEPGLLARAHRNILYVDEVNLLDDHLVDLLLDSAAMGINTIEREGISFSHPARFTLVGTMNPEEGELRPQLLDRFGLCVQVGGISTTADRVEIMERRLAFENDPEAFARSWQHSCDDLTAKIDAARRLLPEVTISRRILEEVAQSCIEVGVDGHRGDIIMVKTARTLAAFDGRTEVGDDDVHAAAELVLPHRIRRQPLMDIPESVNEYRLRRR